MATIQDYGAWPSPIPAGAVGQIDPDYAVTKALTLARPYQGKDS